jgi:hypothetical protein
MAWPNDLQVALKEWASVCHALETGRQLVLLRKGGILDNKGQFELENREFLLFPTYLHQKRELLKPSERATFEERTEEPSHVDISSSAVVTDVVMIKSRAQVDAIDDLHVWTAPHIDMRFAYKPRAPLYLVVLRAYRLAKTVSLTNTPEYAGCRSWVPLDEPVSTTGAGPALDDDAFQTRRAELMTRLECA